MYAIEIIDIADENARASICAVGDKVVYEHPKYADITRAEAKSALSEIANNADEEEIELDWNLISA